MAEEKVITHMSSRTRALVLAITAPVLAFAILGGFLGKAMAREDTYPHLRMFDEVLNYISNNYVEPVDVGRVMHGAMHGLADGLDPDSAYLTPEEVRQVESKQPLPAGSIGLDLTRQYYLRVLAVRDNSPAQKAGLRTGDYVRAIGDTPTREMSVWEGVRALHGAPGTKVSLTIIRGNAADPHVVELTRETLTGPDVTSRIAAPGIGYIRIAAVTPKTAEHVKAAAAELAKNGAAKLIVDVRRASGGDLDDGIAVARLFVANGTLAIRDSRSAGRQPIAAESGDGAITLPAALLIDTGTSGAAEVFAAALSGNNRAELIGEHTIGRAAVQKLIKLPDGSGLWLSTTRYLTPSGTPLQEKGLEPQVSVDQPDVEFGQPAPTTDPVLDKAIDRLAARKAA